MNYVYKSPHKDRYVLSAWHLCVAVGFLAYMLADFWPQLDVRVDTALISQLNQDPRFQDNIRCRWSSAPSPDTSDINLLFFCGFHACAPSISKLSAMMVMFVRL